MASIAELTARIKALEISIARLASEKYPQTIYLHQINGVGPITSLYLVLKIENPQRFTRTRNIGAFVGLGPKRDPSGETDKELRISKCGDRYLRRLLVSAAQHILGTLRYRKVRYVTTDYDSPRTAPLRPRSGPLLLWPESSLFCC